MATLSVTMAWAKASSETAPWKEEEEEEEILFRG